MAAFNSVTIVGVGLLGGSLGLALKHHHWAGHIRGVGHREATLEEAQSLGAIDDYTTDIRQAADADLVVICTPAGAVPGYLDIIRSLCKPPTVVTDVASTKGLICRHAARTWTPPRRFIGSHPMAGSEKWGPGHATQNLYHSTVTFVESAPDLDPEARKIIVDLWTRLGSHVVDVEADTHDACVACTSHLPHIAAAALAQISGSIDRVKPFVGNGWRDSTRIAEGRPEIWRDICLTNRDAIVGGLNTYIDILQRVKLAVENGDADALNRYFEEGLEGRWRSLKP